MSASALTAGRRLRLARPSRSHAVPLLQAFAIAVMVIPSDSVIKTIGAGGYVAGLIGMFAFAAFVAATLLGLHDPMQHRHPVRSVLLLLWLSTLASYVLMDRVQRTVVELAAADRIVMQVAVISGVALIAAECLTSMADLRRVLRALTWGGAFCGFVAVLQFWISLDITPYLRDLPGFSLNADAAAILDRGGLNRVAGTAIHPIELGVVAGMLLPLAVHLALHDTERTPRSRWAPVVLIGAAIPTSVSRSAILSVAVAFATLIVLMPPRQRLVALCAVPFAVGGVFMTAHGVIGTLQSFFGSAKTDDSVLARTSDYPLVERLLAQSPWFGRGGGTWIPENPLDIFDNQYLRSAVEMGLVGLVALIAFFLVPTIAALVARRRTADPELRLLCAALAGSLLAAAVSSISFDSFSFPMFANVCALVVGMIGASWRLATAGGSSAAEPIRATRLGAPAAGTTPASTPRTVRSAGG